MKDLSEFQEKKKRIQHAHIHASVLFLTLNAMDEGINPFSQSKEKTKGQIVQTGEKKRASREKDKMRVRKRNISLWQLRPQLETNLRQCCCTSAAADHPGACSMSPALSYHQTMQCHNVTGKRPMLLLHDRMHQWQRSTIAFKQMEHEVTHRDRRV